MSQGGKRFVRGQNTKIRPGTLNTMLDAAQDFRNRSFAGGGQTPDFLDAQHGIVLVQNNTGADLPIYSVVAIYTLLTTPNPTTGDDHRDFVFSGIKPQTGYEQQFGILQEPIASTAYGHVMIVGVTPVMISRPTGDTTNTAGILAGQTYMQTGNPGAIILWEDLTVSPSTTPHNALVSVPSGGASTPQTVVVDRVASASIASLSGTVSVDGSNAPNGSLVLAAAQVVGGFIVPGIYKVNTSGAWGKSNPFAPACVYVSSGSNLSKTGWFLPNGGNLAYQPISGVYG